MGFFPEVVHVILPKRAAFMDKDITPSTLSRGSLKTALIWAHASAQYLHGIPHEEDRNVVADHIEVPFSCVKLDSKASRIRNRLGTTLFVNHS
jgi:hypothetical protein